MSTKLNRNEGEVAVATTRRKHDQYFTPALATQALLAHVPIRGTVLECCSGDDDIKDELVSHLYSENGLTHVAVMWVLTNDIDPKMSEADYHLDASLPESWQQFPEVDWVITNPPFSLAPKIVPLAFEHAQVGIAMLLRKTYTEPCFDRQEWLSEHKDNFRNQIFLPRISFTGNGKSDNVACDWYVWTKESVGGCKPEWILK